MSVFFHDCLCHVYGPEISLGFFFFLSSPSCIMLMNCCSWICWPDEFCTEEDRRIGKFSHGTSAEARGTWSSRRKQVGRPRACTDNTLKPCGQNRNRVHSFWMLLGDIVSCVCVCVWQLRAAVVCVYLGLPVELSCSTRSRARAQSCLPFLSRRALAVGQPQHETLHPLRN